MATIHRDQLAPVGIRCSGRANLSASITPNYGANLVSFKVDGTELILWDPQALIAGMSHTGGVDQVRDQPHQMISL